MARGRIIVAQEQTFRLATDGGPTLLLTLSVHGANRPAELVRFRDEGTLVDVVYEGEPGFDSGVAHAVRPI